ncbi:MAG: PrsW family intramembrane metalloprotease [Anaerolineae bacterium]
MLIAIVAVLGAVIPTVFYVSFIWWLDRYEKEPAWLLILSFLWGAVPAAILSVLLELIADASIFAVSGEGLVGTLASVSVSAPLVEESAKGVALLGLVLLFGREFDDVLDGIVYGAMIGFGFALSENLFAYFLPILATEGLEAGLTNILMRTVVFGFNHAFWTGVTGAAVAYARLASQWRWRLLAPLAGWSAAVALHGIHNAGATLAEQTLCLSLIVSLAAHWGGVLLLLTVAYVVWRREREWIQRGLAEEVRRGTLTPEEYRLLGQAGQRRRVRWQALIRGGREGHRAVGRYFHTATELAFQKQHLRTRGGRDESLQEVHRLRQALAVSRDLAWPWLWPDAA